MRLDRITVFRLGAGILIAGALVHVTTAWPRVGTIAALLEDIPGTAWLPVAGFAVSALTAVLACGLAALLLWKAADRADARALTLFLCFLAIFWGSLFRFLHVEAGQDTISASLSYGSGWVSRSASTAFVLATAAFVRFSALFPRPLTPDRLRPARRFRALRRLRAALLRGPVVWSVAIGGLLVVQLMGLIVSRVAGSAPSSSAAARGVWIVPLSAAVMIYLILPPAAVALGTRNLRASYRIASAEERGRILWVVSGFSAAWWMILGAMGIMAAIVTLDVEIRALGAVVPLALFLAPLVVVTCAALGILRSGALDGRLVLQRSTVYGALGAVGVVTFAGLENALSALVEERLGLPGIVGSIVAGAAVTAALIPVRGPLKRLVSWYARKLSDSAAASDQAGVNEDLREGPDHQPAHLGS